MIGFALLRQKDRIPGDFAILAANCAVAGGTVT